MDKSLHKSLNKHLKFEFEASHKYLAMSLWFDLHDLPGFASWLRAQSSDEIAHAHRIIDHLAERDLTVDLPAIDKPRGEYDSALEAIETVLASEQKVTSEIEKLYDQAEKVSDRPTMLMLQWFISEQVEEENQARALIGRLKLGGDSGVGLMMVDQELAKGSVPGAMEDPA